MIIDTNEELNPHDRELMQNDLKTGTTFKFFAEFYRISDCKKFIETNERIGGSVVSDQNVQVTFEGVHLYDIDREALFFSAPTEEDANAHQDLGDDQIAPEQRRKSSISREGKFGVLLYLFIIFRCDFGDG